MDVISKTLHGMQIEINVRELLMDRLSFFFRPDNDFSIGDSINFLLSCGLSDLDLMNSLNIPRTTYRRYRNHGVINSKTKMDTLEMKQKTELATVLN
jgi:hypothetical protein